MSSEVSASAPVRAPAAWPIAAHVLGAAALGALDTARLGSLKLALAVVPLFAATGLLIGLVVAGIERLVSTRQWWVAAFALTAPALVVFVPLSRSLFQGAYAQTLPGASAAPYLLPLALWIGAAGATALGRRLLRAGDLIMRAIVVLAVAGALGAIIWVERNVLRSGYPTIHMAATIALIVLIGIGVRITYRGGMPALVTAVFAAITLGTAIPSTLVGLRSSADRQALTARGSHARDLVGVWRRVLDFDRDGSSRVLGGGDCDDRDSKRHPGAIDTPGDGIDQDCDGLDASNVAVAPPPAAPTKAALDSWRAQPEVAELLAKTRDMNVLLITVDALRADLLAPDAQDRADFPTITKLLDESVWFTRAFAPASGTDVSLTTLLTGRFDPFQPVDTTLPEAIRTSGRRTYAALPAEVLRYAGETLLGRGLDKLMTVYTDWDQKNVGDHVSAPATTSEGLKALHDAGDKPTFIWLHYFDVHEHHQIAVPKRLREAVHDGGSKKVHDYRALLRAIDDEVARVIAELDARQLTSKTIIIFASDHGESLGEDPRLLETHGKVTYAPLVRIPIAFRIPGVKPGKRTELVTLVDIAPTLFTLLGITPTDMPLDGIDLVPTLLDAPAALRPSASRPHAIHEEEQWSIVEWPYQLIVRPADNIVELYDVERDPTQHQDLSATQPDVVARLKSRFASFPQVVVDRTVNGRSERERLARQRPSHAP